MKALIAAFLLAGSQPTYVVPDDISSGPHQEIELVGVIGTRPFLLHDQVADGTVLQLLEPIDLAFSGSEAELRNVLDLILHAWSDPALFEIDRMKGKLVRVNCVVAPDSFFGYKHASCNPTSIEVLPNNSFKRTPLRGAAQFRR